MPSEVAGTSIVIEEAIMTKPRAATVPTGPKGAARPAASDVAVPMSVAERYLAALAGSDRDALWNLVADSVDFQGLTPRRLWEATTPDQVCEIVLGTWLREDYDPVVVPLGTGCIGDREYVSYRANVNRGEGLELELLEQHAFLTALDGRITWMRVLCSGYCPRAGAGGTALIRRAPWRAFA
jgi:hypothetical protein